MKAVVLKEKLKTGLKIIERIAQKSLTLPILENVLISVEKNYLCLSATNLEIGINYWILTKTEKEGKITAPAHFLSNFINLLPEEKVVLEAKNQFLNIECDQYENQIKTISADDFPIIPTIKEGEYIEVNTVPFSQALSQVAEIVAFNQSSPEISGVFFSFQKDHLKVVATDRFRLAEKTLFYDQSSKKNILQKQNYSFILPQKTVQELINIFSDKSQPLSSERKLKVFFSTNQVMFEYPAEDANSPHPQMQIVSRLIEGEYPNYQEIIPKKYETEIVLSKNEFLNRIRTASLFSTRLNNEIRLIADLKQQNLALLAQNPEIGENRSFLPGKIKGEKAEISFNSRFLVDGINNIKSQEIFFGLNGEAGASVLKPIGDASYLYVVMPIKA